MNPLNATDCLLCTLREVGILLGFILIQPSDFTDFQTHLALLLDEFQWEFDMPQLPQFDLTVVENEWRRLKSNIPEFPEPWKLSTNGLEFTVGERMAARGLSAEHPVVLVPGVISTVSHYFMLPWKALICLSGPRVMVHHTRIPAFLP